MPDRLRKTRASILAVVAFGTVALGAVLLAQSRTHQADANASPASELLSEIPPGAPMLVYVDLGAIRKSSFYEHRPSHAPLTIPDPDYARFVRATGFDFEKDLDQVILASWPQPAPAKPKTAVVAEGRFDRQKILDYAKKNGRIVHQQGREVFQFPSQKAHGWESLTFLNSHRIVMVQGMSVTQFLAHRGEAATKDPVREQAARMDGASAFVISRAPLVPDGIASEGKKNPQLANLAHSLRMVTLSGRPQGDNFRFSLEGNCRTSTGARQIENMLGALRMMLVASFESPRARQQMGPVNFRVVSDLLKSAEITASANRVRVLLEFTPEIFKLSNSRHPQAKPPQLP